MHGNEHGTEYTCFLMHNLQGNNLQPYMYKTKINWHDNGKMKGNIVIIERAINL